MPKVTGQCGCGAVKYNVSGDFFGVVNCHCKLCQQLHGNYNPMVVVEKSDFSLSQEVDLKWYETSPEKDRGFCSVCGSALFMRQIQGSKMLISVGSLDDTSDLNTIKNIFTEEAGHYYVTPPEEKA